MILSNNGSLVIRATQVDDSGQYRCVTENSRNYSSHLFELLVTSSKPVIQSSTEKSDFNDEIEEIITDSDVLYSDIEIMIPSWRSSLSPEIESKNHSELMKDLEKIEARLNKNYKKGALKTQEEKENPIESGSLLGLIISAIILVAVILGINLILLGMLCTLFLQ